MAEYYQIAFFPYFTISRFDHDRFIIYPLSDLDSVITDPKVKKAVKIRLSLNIDHRQENLNTISLLHRKNNDFSPFSEEETEIIQEIKYLIFFCSLKTNNMPEKGRQYFSWVTADNFEVTYQNFQIDDNNHIGLSYGAIHSIKSIDEIKDVRIQKPIYVNKPLAFGYDEVLLANLLALKTSNHYLFNRVITSIQQLYDSYKNSHDVSWASRMLLLMVAFEILFEMDASGQRKQLKDKFKTFLSNRYETNNSDPIVKYQSPRWANSPAEGENEPIRVHYAEKFYLLRNDIIHGNQPATSEYMYEHQRIYDIGVMFLILAIERIINDSDKQETYCDDIIWDNSDRRFFWKDGSLYKTISEIIDSNQ